MKSVTFWPKVVVGPPQRPPPPKSTTFFDAAPNCLSKDFGTRCYHALRRSLFFAIQSVLVADNRPDLLIPTLS